jgi:hypothetical protein
VKIGSGTITFTTLIAIFPDVTWNGSGTITFTTLIAIFTDVTWNGSGTITFTTKSNRSSAIPSDIGENGNQVGTDSDSDSSYTTARDSCASSTKSGAEEPCYENLAISKNDDLGNQTREHNPDDYDLYENSTY